MNRAPMAAAPRRKGDLVRTEEIERVIDVLRAAGVPIGAVDIRRDGVTVHPPESNPGNAFDTFMAQDKNRDRSAHRQ